VVIVKKTKEQGNRIWGRKDGIRGKGIGKCKMKKMLNLLKLTFNTSRILVGGRSMKGTGGKFKVGESISERGKIGRKQERNLDKDLIKRGG